jgi:membrane fusion protein (multidrug efflux system)
MSDPNPSAVPASAPAKPARRGAALRILLLVVVVAAIGWTAWYYLDGRWYEQTDDAYVNGNVVQITPLVPGTVVSIGADDGQLVHEGQVMVQLDSNDMQTALAQTEAALARTVRQVRGMYNGVDSSQAVLATRRADLERAQVDYTRRKNLATTGAISAEELSHASDALAAAQAAVDAAAQKLASDSAMLDNAGVANQPDVQTAAAALRQAYINNARTRIVAPVTGYVARRSVQLGQRVQQGAPLMAVVPLDQVWVDANFKETQLRQMRLGQPVTLHSDIYGGGIDYKGTVASLGIGTGSAFSLLPAQNASGNWIKIVQRLPVRIALDADQVHKHPLRIGLSMSVEVDLHGDGELLPAKAVGQPVLTTDVYQQQVHEADALVQKIIQENIPASAHAATAHAMTEHSMTAGVASAHAKANR